MWAIGEGLRIGKVNSISIRPIAIDDRFQRGIPSTDSDSEESSIDVAKPDTTIGPLIRIVRRVEVRTHHPVWGPDRPGQPLRRNQAKLLCRKRCEHCGVAAGGIVLRGGIK